jgi:hypothetical protein
MLKIHQSSGPATPEVIGVFEDNLGPLPEPYRRFVQETNGGKPTPAMFTCFQPDNPSEPAGTEVVQLFFRFNSIEGLESVGVQGLLKTTTPHGHPVQSHFRHTQHFPPRLMAVGICCNWRRGPGLRNRFILLSIRPDDFGKVYLFVQAKSKGGGVTWNNPYDEVFLARNLYPVADDFGAFLNGLHWLPESEPWITAVEFGEVLKLRDWATANGDVDRQCPAFRLNSLEYACLGNVFTPRTPAVEAACVEMAALLAPRSAAPEAALEWAGQNWLAIAAVIPYVRHLGTLKRVRKELQEHAEIMPVFTNALTEEGRIWAAQLPQLREVLDRRIRELR